MSRKIIPTFYLDQHIIEDSPVDFAMAPMSTGGSAMMMQPKAATYDSSCARPAVLLLSTRWKYT